MSAPRKRGRRDNGLDAVAFRPLRDVDPRVGEHLLDVLRAAGIAAYLDPTSDVDAVTRSIALPSPPSDRLHVDRAQTDDAVALLHDYDLDAADPDADDPSRGRVGGTRAPSRPPALTAGPPADSPPSSAADDAQWSQLVAAYEADHGRLGDTLTSDFDEAAAAQAAARATASQAATEAAEVAEEEHYEPPPPPPLPILSRAAAYALVLIVGGALLLVAPGVIGLSGELGFVFGVLGIASGVGMLVWRMREGPQYEDPDDGAVV